MDEKVPVEIRNVKGAVLETKPMLLEDIARATLRGDKIELSNGFPYRVVKAMRGFDDMKMMDRFVLVVEAAP